MKRDKRHTYRFLGIAILGAIALPLWLCNVNLPRRTVGARRPTPSVNISDNRQIVALTPPPPGVSIMDAPNDNQAKPPRQIDTSEASTESNAPHPDPKTSIPAIARLLGVRIGINGRDRLERKFGTGSYSVGGHPNGIETWRTRSPKGEIVTEGFCYNDEGEALENVDWSLESKSDSTIPRIHHLPYNAGWMGVINLGMTKAQVAQLTAKRLPPPKTEFEDEWIWEAKGFYRPSPVNGDVYRKWSATLIFEHDRVASIDVACDSEYSAPQE